MYFLQCLYAGETFLVFTSDTFGRIFNDTESQDYMAKQVNFISALRKNIPDVTVASLGNFSAPDYMSMQSGGRILEPALELIGYDFVVPGRHDLRLGTANLARIFNRCGIKALCANLLDDVLDVEKLHRTGRGDLNLVIAGLCAPGSSWETMGEHGLSGARITDAVAALKDLMPEIKKGDYLILADSLTFDENIILASKFPRINLIVCPRTGGHQSARFNDTDLLCVDCGVENIGLVRIYSLDGETGAQISSFNMKNIPEHKGLAQIHRQALDEFNGNDHLLCLVEEPARFPETVAGIMKTFTRAEIAFVNRGYFHEKLISRELTHKIFDRMFQFNDSCVCGKMTGKSLRAIEASSRSRTGGAALICSGMQSGKVNGIPLVDNELYRVAVLEFLVSGEHEYARTFRGMEKIDKFGSFRETLRNHLQSAGTLPPGSDAPPWHELKYTYLTRLDLSFTDIHFNSSRDQYQKRGISQLKGQEKSFFNGRYETNQAREGRLYTMTSFVRADVEKQKDKEETSRLQTIFRHLPKNRNEQKELKIDTSWNRLSDDRYPLTVNIGFLRNIGLGGFLESRFGLSMQKNFANQDETGGVQLYLKNRKVFYRFTLENYLDYFQGMVKSRSSTASLENRFSCPITSRASWFLTCNNYFYRDREIGDWANQRRVYSGFSVSLGGKRG